MSTTYAEFLESKRVVDIPTGIDSDVILNPALFQFQHDITNWAIRRGRANIFADCGLGKTLMQLEWAHHICDHESKPALILAPLAVSAQTKREGEKFGIPVTVCRHGDDVRHGINVTNYEMLHHFDPSVFCAIVLDESSILKNYSGKTRTEIIEAFKRTPFRLACTATPSPNDFMELGNHSEFHGVMSRSEMLSMFFVHDGGDTSQWRLKGHAENDFWRWLCSFSVMIRKPSDLGYENDGFDLPELSIHNHVIDIDDCDYSTGFLLRMPAATLQERIRERRFTIEKRCRKSAEIALSSDDPCLLWCDLNDESSMLAKLTGAYEISGSMSNEAKERGLIGFSDGTYKRIVTKPSIAGFGMNWQHCSKMVFTGLSDSYEQYYQSIRRCWRFGQKNNVDAHIVTASTEGAVVDNIRRKDANAEHMMNQMLQHMNVYNSESLHGTRSARTQYTPKERILVPSWINS